MSKIVIVDYGVGGGAVEVEGAFTTKWTDDRLVWNASEVGCTSIRVEVTDIWVAGNKDDSMSIPRCQAYRNKLADHGVAAELIVYEGAGHGWELPTPAEHKAGAWVTKDCEMMWMADGQNIEQTTGLSMDSPLSAFRALLSCANQDGYTMGGHAGAKEQSWRDTLAFLTNVWNLEEINSD